MKKHFYMIFLGIAISIQSIAQTIPNPDFETWVSGFPTGWSNSSSASFGISQSTDAQHGTSSVKISTLVMGGVSIPGLLLTNNGNLLGASTKPAYLNGYIKASLISTDTFMFEVYFENTVSGTGGGGVDITGTSRSTWTPFHITLNYPAAFAPDSFGIAMYLTGASTSYAMIDNLSFGNTPIGNELGTASVGIRETKSQNIHAMISPNPVMKSADVNFVLTLSALLSAKIYDVTGRLVKSISDEYFHAGTHKLEINADDLSNGIYFVNIAGNGINETKKFIVNK